MTRSNSFHCNLNVLFFHPANTRGSVRNIENLLIDPNSTPLQALCPYVAALAKDDFRTKVGAKDLIFYQPDPALPISRAKVWFQEHIGLPELDGNGVTELQYAQRLTTVLDMENIGKDDVDLVIRGVEREEEGNEEDDTVPFGPFKRYTTLEAKVTGMSPSTAAKSRERLHLQGSQSTVIFDGTFVPRLDSQGRKFPAIETVAQPIAIFFPLFEDMAAKLDDPGFIPDSEILRKVHSLISVMGLIALEDDDYSQQLRTELTALLGEYVSEQKTEKRGPDGLLTLAGILPTPLWLGELKRTIGEGGCDPVPQAAYSLLNWWVGQKSLKDVRDRCPCPTLIVASGGPHISLHGAVWTDRFIVQRLSNFEFMARQSTSADDQLYELARFFTVMKWGIEQLKIYYTDYLRRIADNVIPPLVSNKPHPRFFPQVTKFKSRQTGESVQFRYLSAINDDDSQNLTYLAETTDDPQKMIVKFSDRYGSKAHELLAANHFAPQLYYCGLLDGEHDVSESEEYCGSFRGALYKGPLHMIVMEYLDGKTAAQLPQQKWPKNTRKSVCAAINLLHDEDLVFGDLRLPNVMFVGEDVKLIDFDWSGKAKEVFYPAGLSSKVTWAQGVKSFCKIEKKHDLDMLDLNFPVESFQ